MEVSCCQGVFLEGTNKHKKLLHIPPNAGLKKQTIQRQVRIFGWTTHTISDWQQFLKNMCYFDAKYLPHIIGGEGCAVEIDEIIMSKKKNNVGPIYAC